MTFSLQRRAFLLSLIAFGLFLVAPAGSRSPFSGIPFASKALPFFALFLVLIVAAAFFHPRQQPRLRWTVLLLVCFALKVFAATQLVPIGWRGTYWTMWLTKPPQRTFSRISFFDRGRRSWRVDAALDMIPDTFGLHSVNDLPPVGVVLGRNHRDEQQPLQVIWTGWTEVSESRRVAGALTAHGSVEIALDRQLIAAATNPRQLSLAPTVAAGRHLLTVRYTKPADAKPDIHVALPGLVITPFPVSTALLARSRTAAIFILLTGIVALVALAAATREAFHPVSQLLLEDLWLHIDRVAAIAFFAWFVFAGLSEAIPIRRMSISMGIGDDPLAYEGQARSVLQYGPAMIDPAHPHVPYYFYPLYSYVLAGTHALLGEDFANVVLTNYLCLAVIGILVWALLQRWLEAEAVAAALFLVALFVRADMAGYAYLAFSDNLYVPMVLLVTLTGIKAFERRSLALAILTGILTALGGATRPSLLILLPFMLSCVAMFWPSARIRGRVLPAGGYGFGFVAGIAPFTIRNWIVAHKLVLVISSYLMLPYFLYAPEEPVPAGWLLDNSPTFTAGVHMAAKVFASRPLHYLWVEIRKVLFTFGFQHFDLSGSMPSHLILLPILFGLVLWTGRIPRWTKIVLVFVLLSHLAAMVIAAPWTYGYKTIIPFHLLLGLGAAFLLPLRSRVPSPVPERAVVPQTTPSGRRTVSVILPTYNEKDSIRQVILDFFATGAADEVLVINNNAAPGTSEEVAGTGAREIFEPRQGYGAAIRRGLREATGDYIVICEPDGTFMARDIVKLLAYADDFDVVYGSRTSLQMVLKGANMGFFLRWGNWAVAKYLELLYNATSLTDVGCTMRLIRREVAQELQEQFRIDGNQFGPEMMILTLHAGYRVVQIPVSYCERVGVSSVTGDPSKAFLLGLQMIWLITWHRFRDLFVTPAPPPPEPSTLSPHHGQ